MRIKHRPEDFRVEEQIAEGYLKDSGRFRVYRVKKRKLTSLEAADVLADLAGCPASEVGLAGLKDRQGVTVQYMSVPVRKPVQHYGDDLVIETAGFADEMLESRHSLGNSFDLRLRGVTSREFEGLETELAAVREQGVINYFGEQRFGNLRFGQGWIARELALGNHEKALQQLLCSSSEQDDERNRRYKAAWQRCWGDWRECRDIAGRAGQFHSVFEHLAREPEDFAGAFTYVSSRLRLIHLYAWQSHLWNRTVANWVRESGSRKDSFWVESIEGRLFFPAGALLADPTMNNNWRIPGPGLEDVTHPRQRELYVKALSLDGLSPEQFRIEGVSGFQLKGEDRELVIHPRNLRVAEEDRDLDGFLRLRIGFDLPRGAYATMLLARLFPAPDVPVEEEPQFRDRLARPRRSRGPRMDGPRRDGPRRDGPRREWTPRSDAPRDERAPRPDAPRTDEPRRYGPRNEGPRTEGPRWNGPRGDGPRRFGPRNDGPRDDGPRRFGPRNDGPRRFGPRNDGPRDDGPRRFGPREDGPRRFGPRNDGPRDDGPRRFGPRDDGPRGDGPRRFGPRGDGPRRFGPRGDGPRRDGPRPPRGNTR